MTVESNGADVAKGAEALCRGRGAIGRDEVEVVATIGGVVVITSGMVVMINEVVAAIGGFVVMIGAVVWRGKVAEIGSERCGGDGAIELVDCAPSSPITPRSALSSEVLEAVTEVAVVWAATRRAFLAARSASLEDQCGAGGRFCVVATDTAGEMIVPTWAGMSASISSRPIGSLKEEKEVNQCKGVQWSSRQKNKGIPDGSRRSRGHPTSQRSNIQRRLANRHPSSRSLRLFAFGGSRHRLCGLAGGSTRRGAGCRGASSRHLRRLGARSCIRITDF